MSTDAGATGPTAVEPADVGVLRHEPTSPFAARPGAVLVHGVVEHYGDLFGEQRRLAAGRAVVALGDRAVLRVSGADRLSWLDSLTSQRLIGLEPGVGAETLLLDPSGHVERAAAVLDDGEVTWLVVDAVDAGPFAAFLDRMRFMLRVEVADVSDEYGAIGLFGDSLGARLQPGPVWLDPWRTGAQGGVTAARDPEPAASWDFRIHVLPWAAIASVAASDVPAAGVAALEALRIAAWRPRRALEVDARTLPHELDWLRSAVHLAKGCYRGQETVAKVHNLGRPPRRIVQLDLDGSDNRVVRHGDVVRAGEQEVGRVTSAALHYEQGPIALAVVRRAVPEDQALVVEAADGPISAAQRVIVPADTGPAVAVPRLPRLGRAG